MINTKIEWCDSTWSPVSGCMNDCPYCYARKTANRFKGCNASPDGSTGQEIIALDKRMPVTNKDGVTRSAAYPYGFTPTLHEYRLNDLQTKSYGKTIFVCSMADLFGPWVPDEWILKVFDACKQASNHRYLFLTKNPARYVALGEKSLLPEDDNFWYGTTTEDPDQQAFFSKRHHTFVSVEPIMAPFGNVDLASGIVSTAEWAIFGAETGSRTDKIVPERSWVEGVVQAFQDMGKPVFMKNSMKPIWGDDIITQFPWRY